MKIFFGNIFTVRIGALVDWDIFYLKLVEMCKEIVLENVGKKKFDYFHQSSRTDGKEVIGLFSKKSRCF